MTKDSKNLIVGLDIGTSKVVVVVAEIREDDSLNVIGLGSAPSRGLKRGMVVDIEKTVLAIQTALGDAELMADCKINEVIAGIAGSHIQGMNSDGMVAIKDREVTQADMDRVMETARAVSIPSDHEVLHVIPQEFVIDGQEGVKEPLGMSGVRLEVRVHIVSGAVSAVQNVTKCVRRCGLEISEVVLQPLASSYAVLTEDEKELGVCLIDIGGGTTDIAIFAGGSIRYTAVIPVAGDQITNDIAQALRTPTNEAEVIKLQHGVALRHLTDQQQMIEVPGVGERGSRSMSRHTLAEVIEPRVEELYNLAIAEVRRSGWADRLSSGVVITGGAATMPGMVEIGEELFHQPVRLGLPRYVGGLAEVVKNPRYSTAVGLLLLAREQMMRGPISRNKQSGLGQVLLRLKTWVQNNF